MAAAKVGPDPLLPVLVIDRERWGRGDPKTGALMNDQGKMCCLGFAAEACGLELTPDSDVMMPADLGDAKYKMPEWMCPQYDDGSWPNQVTKAAQINDEAATTDAAKEEALKALFAMHGTKLYFVDKKGDVPPELAKKKRAAKKKAAVTKTKKTIGRKNKSGSKRTK